jgi:hypothetical protein
MKNVFIFLIGMMFGFAFFMFTTHMVWWQGLLCISGLTLYTIFVNEASVRRF